MLSKIRGIIGDWLKNEDDHDDEASKKKQSQAPGVMVEKKSGISVQNQSRGGNTAPSESLVKNLLQRAAENGPGPGPHDPESGPSAPDGEQTGRSNETPSTSVTDPSASAQEEAALRYITFWNNGFQFGEGDLMSYDDPQNMKVLAMMNEGGAPVDLLDVKKGQLVELRVLNKTREPYHPPDRSTSVPNTTNEPDTAT